MAEIIIMFTNDLIYETSPYLLQHAHNPVHWNAWNEKTLDRAKKEDKMLLVSIGYAACHWCHVMERESFENEEVADLMNENFVCIKVDREERPDVDQIYMTAAQLINGNGGWPLNTLALPDGKPFYAATYFPKDKWMQLLRYFIGQYKTNRDELKKNAEDLADGIRQSDLIPEMDGMPDFSFKEVKSIVTGLIKETDPYEGGLAGTMKFPMPSVWGSLLLFHHLTGDRKALEITELTIKKMASGGIFDHIGGGFARYSTDPYWHVPHFEKMLYDNAELISLYSHVYQVTKNPHYKKIIEQTIDFVLRELSSENSFFSSLDADSDGEEGKYYTWAFDEIEKCLGEDADKFSKYFHLTKEGNWSHGKNILIRDFHSFNQYHDTEEKFIDKAEKKLLEIRSKRIRPALDDKVITSWNAMMSEALIDAANALGNADYLQRAGKTLDFLLKNLWSEDEGLFRNFQKEKASTHAFLDDYAFLIHALIAYYQSTFKREYLIHAEKLADYVLKCFGDDSGAMLFYNNTLYDRLISRPVETMDNVIPSSNAVMAENLFLLGTLLSDDEKINRAAAMVKNVRHALLSSPPYFSFWLRVMMLMQKDSREVVIMGSGCLSFLNQLKSEYFPHCVFCGSEKEEYLPLMEQRYKDGKTLIYVCQNKTCKMPVSSVKDALPLLQPERITI